MKRLDQFGRSALYWWGLLVLALALEAVALFYQHVLEELPCALCIHMRLWILALVPVSLLGLWLRNRPRAILLAHGLVAVIAAGMLERSYQLLGTERGFTYSDCGFNLGLPPWLPLESWFPWLLQVQTSCGYTPVLPLGVTMAEALIVTSALLLLLGLALLVATVAGLAGGRGVR